jgi:hypothetical protein
MMLQPTLYKERDVSGLLKLSGMKYKQGYFTPAEWQYKTGVNPLEWPGFISVRSGLCFWEAAAERVFQARADKVNYWWVVLGVAERGVK